MKKEKSVSVRLDKATYSQLTARSNKNNVSIAVFVRELILDCLENYENATMRKLAKNVEQVIDDIETVSTNVMSVREGQAFHIKRFKACMESQNSQLNTLVEESRKSYEKKKDSFLERYETQIEESKRKYIANADERIRLERKKIEYRERCLDERWRDFRIKQERFDRIVIRIVWGVIFVLIGVFLYMKWIN